MARAPSGNTTRASRRCAAIFVAGSQQVGDNIDNITASPRGGLLLCENGEAITDEYGQGTRLIGITADGDSYAFAKNNIDLTLEDQVAVGQADLRGLLPRRGMGGRLLRSGRRSALRQHPDPGHHVRHLGSLGARQPVITKGTTPSPAAENC